MAHLFAGYLLRPITLVAIAFVSSVASAQGLTEDDIVLESWPEDVVATMEARDQWLAALPPVDGDGVQFFFLVDLQRWSPGSTVTVAFLGGNSALHKQI